MKIIIEIVGIIGTITSLLLNNCDIIIQVGLAIGKSGIFPVGRSLGDAFKKLFFSKICIEILL